MFVAGTAQSKPQTIYTIDYGGEIGRIISGITIFVSGHYGQPTKEDTQQSHSSATTNVTRSPRDNVWVVVPLG